jgi:zona occludens toxin
MAAHIFHGAPGSFKSATVMWFRVLEELRKGRLVVTNIEGILDKESIEIELDEVFPETADIWRLSSQTDEGLYLWKRWFWWMPVKAFIVMDEIQDIFPNDTTVFKPIQFDIPEQSSGIELLKDKLPTKFYEHYIQAIYDFSPDDIDSLKDDTGQVVLDENNNIIYPKTMREANMRHRKYNWDIVYCTPVIDDIHKLVRSVCEFAYAHKYLEQLEFIPYYHRRTRIHEHSPKSSGYPKKKDDPTKWRKIPVQVHKLYRSTSTGKVSSNGGGVNALKNPVLLFTVTVLFFAVGYALWWGFIKPDRATIQERSGQVVEENLQISSEATTENPTISNSFDPIQNPNEINISIKLPYNANEIYFNGYVDIKITNSKRDREYLFTLLKGREEYLIDGDNLKSMGFLIRFIDECSVKIVNGDNSRIVYCPPRKLLPPIQYNESV